MLEITIKPIYLSSLNKSIWGSFLCKIVAHLSLRMLVVSSLGRQGAGWVLASTAPVISGAEAEPSQTELTGALIEQFNGIRITNRTMAPDSRPFVYIVIHSIDSLPIQKTHNLGFTLLKHLLG